MLFACLCLGCITISFNVGAIAAVIPAISRDLALSEIVTSRIIPFYMVPYGICALLYAPLAMKFSLKSILIVSMMVYAAASVYCANAGTLGHFLAARAVTGLAGSGAVPLALVIIGALTEKHIRGRLVGVFFSCSFIASLAGVAMSGIAHWRWLFYLPAVIGVLTALCIALFVSDITREVAVTRVNYLDIFHNKNIRRIFIFIFAISFLWHGVRDWMGVYLSQVYSLDQLTISAFFVLLVISGAVGQLLGGYLADKRGRLATCKIGLWLLAAATFLLSVVFPLPVLAVVLVALSAGWTIGHNGVSTALTDFPDEHRAEIASLNSSVRFLSGGIGFFISSIFVQQSFAVTFLIFGVAMAALSVLLKRAIPES